MNSAHNKITDVVLSELYIDDVCCDHVCENVREPVDDAVGDLVGSAIDDVLVEIDQALSQDMGTWRKLND